ncbi:MAG: hypothetical protein ABR567_14030 [Myxococcales bacterium]
MLIALSLAAEVLVGVYEQQENRVRAAFRHDPDGWHALPFEAPDPRDHERLPASVPETVDWTIARDGKAIGSASSRRQAHYEAYAQIGQMEVTRKAVRPVKTARLVAVSQPNVADPDGWKPSPLDAKSRERALAAFRKKIPKREICDKKTYRLLPRDYRDAEVKSLKSYRSASGARVVRLQLEVKEQNCEYGDEDVPYLDSHTFGITAAGEVVPIAQNLTVVDAGDYDNDGRSELVFFQTDEAEHNEEAYLLVTADFRTAAKFRWSHH